MIPYYDMRLDDIFLELYRKGMTCDVCRDRLRTKIGSVLSVGVYAFNNCENLTSVSFEYGTTDIGEGAFMTCPALTSVTLPDSIIGINSCLFQGSGITEITIPESCKYIYDYAFNVCENL